MNIQVDTIWRLHCDAKKQHYTLTVEYHSGFRPERHDEIHTALFQQARQWLEEKGFDLKHCDIKIHYCCPCEAHAETQNNALGNEEQIVPQQIPQAQEQEVNDAD